MAFQKGKSGNPGGRPKADVELRALARTSTDVAPKADMPARILEEVRIQGTPSPNDLIRIGGSPGVLKELLYRDDGQAFHRSEYDPLEELS